MGVAALIIGIISIIVGFIPLCGAIAFFPAVIGLILGIVDIVLKSKAGQSKGMGIAGTILSAIAIVVIFLWVFVVGVAASSPDVQRELQNDLQDELNNVQLDNY